MTQRWRKVVANQQGLARDFSEDRPTDPIGHAAFDARKTDPDLSRFGALSWEDEASSRTRAIVIAKPWGYAVRVWIAVRLARAAAWIAP